MRFCFFFVNFTFQISRMKRQTILFLLLFVSQVLWAQEQLVFKSKNLPKPDTVWVFSPQNAKPNQTLPLVFLLHGYSGNYKQWDNIMKAQAYANEYGFILVCPDGLYNSWYLNSPIKKDWQYESFFFDELYPQIITKYPVQKDKVFITGLSMGGHGALHLFLQKPALFASAGSTSGGVKLSDGYGKWGLSSLLGDPQINPSNWDSCSVINQIDKLKDTNKPFIFDCGADDFFYKSNNELKKKCDELKLKATYISQPGGHNRTYWAHSIRQHFDFFKNLIKTDKPN